MSELEEKVQTYVLKRLYDELENELNNLKAEHNKLKFEYGILLENHKLRLKLENKE